MIIIHGLYGSSDNWVNIAKLFQSGFEVIIPDVRNHGRSPHSGDHSYTALSNDIKELLDGLKYEKVVVLGHSMGGKIAMDFTKKYPEMVEKLVVADIVPFPLIGRESYTEIYNFHKTVIDSLCEIDLEACRTRTEVEDLMAMSIPMEDVRKFLLKNVKSENGVFAWKMNLKLFQDKLAELLDGVISPETETVVDTETLFIKGEYSPYLLESDYPVLKRIFPKAEFDEIKGANHWLHAQKPEEFTRKVLDFIAPL